MKIKVKLFGVLRINRFKEEVCEYPDGTDIGAIVEQFKFPDFQLGIILVNDKHATVETPIKDGDVLSLLPVIGGG